MSASTLPYGVVNTLGFTGVGVPACTRFPCPGAPVHHVKICLQINAGSKAVITRGCHAPTPTNECNVQWEDGLAVTEGTWGEAVRVINIDRQVPAGNFIKINLCASDTSACSNPTACFGSTGSGFPNALLKFTVDGLSYRTYLQDVADSLSRSAGCVSVDCADSTNTCCLEPVDLDSMRLGSQIVFGPVGSVTTLTLA
jgi:hypothetical protein